MKKPKRITLVLYGLCAVIWSLRVIIGVMYEEYDYSFGFFILNVLAALVWIAAFVKWMLNIAPKKMNSDNFQFDRRNNLHPVR